ncbi:HS12A-like protein [Mya arenaria]|uniref:HS12A-like protein n=1 Tax=Mya arenaria TaxID=6604 RepID=A0ABY7F596_MYAAR|nr:HS12A-like protein [Mya arenaria]
MDMLNALEKYTELEPKELQSHYFFHHFKMKLYESEKLTRETTLQDQTGKEIKAMDVYSIVLQYFKQRVMAHVGQVKSDQTIQGFSSKEILWMLSIPAIWTDSARQFMREAAKNAELENVRLVLEPEAGALFAIDKPLKLREDKSTVRFPVGHKYILADLGGGTIDICVHEILKSRTLCELYRATGDYAGGSRVNHEFEQFFIKLFGAPAITEFRTKLTHTYQDFIFSIERKKYAFSHSTDKALEKYTELEPEEHQSYYFFYHFKMKLYNSEKLTRETTLQDQTGKEIKAMDVYKIVLQYFKQRVMAHVGQVKSNETIYGFSSKQILWMLSIPAIWTDSARQFMREAAKNAELENVRLVLEPEAGALFAIDKPLKLREDKSTEKFPVGHKYILADLGGGTIDICVHEILGSRTLCELYRATGDYAGSSRVNHEFEQFFVRLFGAPALDELRTKLAHSYHEFISSIERKKCAFSHCSDKVVLPLDYDFVTLVENDNGEIIEDMIKSSRYKDLVQYRKTGRRLTLNNSVVKGFFDSSVDVIIDNLKEILFACAQDNITSLLLVGGYSESPYVRERIQQEFPQLITVIVEDGRLAVMKGAVMMGLKPRNIIQRRARFTYGFSSRPKFKAGEHPEQFKINVDSETQCKGVFDKLIERGQLLQHQQEFSRAFYNTFKQPGLKQMIWHISLWRSPRPEPRYCYLEDDLCERVGRITMQPPPGGWPDALLITHKLIVGETEFTMKVFLKETGHV